jgi:CHAT domain-containing protein
MKEFYQALFSGQSIEQAFSLAQSVMKNKYRKDPYKWAAFVLVR